MKRSVFFISDGTGITAETLGGTLLTQFEGVEFKKITLPFINTTDKARVTVDYINHVSTTEIRRPLVFSTTVNDEVRAIIRTASAMFLDLFSTFVGPLEQEFGVELFVKGDEVIFSEVSPRPHDTGLVTLIDRKSVV